jgi:hypothetical protein
MNSLFEIQGDVYAADAVAAILVFPPNEDEEEEQWTVRIALRGMADTQCYYEDSEEDARQTQMQAVAAWKNALAAR